MDTVVLSAADAAAGGALATALARTPDLIHRSGALAAEVAAAVAGRSTISPEKGDRRFTDPAWSSHPVYRRLSQAYLAVERAIDTAVEDADIDWPTRERARFAAGILATGLSPTNTLVGNPTALKHAFDTGGMSLVRGGRNLLADLKHNRGMPRQVDSTPFVVGENVRDFDGMCHRFHAVGVDLRQQIHVFQDPAELRRERVEFGLAGQQSSK